MHRRPRAAPGFVPKAVTMSTLPSHPRVRTIRVTTLVTARGGKAAAVEAAFGAASDGCAALHPSRTPAGVVPG